jgi:catechol 2,3-dioxygenase-like lactoylglutathione lyase family enzyme
MSAGGPERPDAAGVEPRRLRLRGLHHVTVISADLERTTAFYRDVLGLALVRETHNDDDPDARHFWFGDAQGAAGTLISFLEYPAMEAARAGVGGTHHIAFTIGTADELDGWREWLRSCSVQVTDVFDRGGLRSLYLRDPDGHILELAAPSPAASGGGLWAGRHEG